MKAVDPVCGMSVDTETAAATAEYEGSTYYFCAPGCRQAFVENPEEYLAGSRQGHEHQGHGMRGHGHHGHCC